jgi:membrane protein
MLNFIKKYIQTFDKHICFTRTCALTFNSLLAIVPLFIILFEIVKRLPWFTNAYLSWQQQLLTHLSPESGKHITDILNNLIQRHHHLPIITLIFLIITSGLMIRSVEESLNDIFEVKRFKRRNFFISIVIYILVIIITPCLLGLLIYISQNLHTESFSSIFTQHHILQEILSIVIEMVLLFIFYSALTARKIPASIRWMTSFLVVFLIAILKVLFGLYLNLIPTYKLIYGALAGIPIFFIWLYLCWLCFIGGAVLMQTIALLKLEKINNKE